MNWFDEQLRYREKTDNEGLADAIDSIAGAVMGKRLQSALSYNDIADSAIGKILEYYHCKPKDEEIPSGLKTVEEQTEYRLRPFGIRSRSVILEEGWYRNAVGAMLGTLKEDGSAVALIPGRLSGYRFCNIKTGKWTRLNRRTEKLLDREAMCFYQPLPQKALTIFDLFKFMSDQLSLSDYFLFVGLMIISAALGLLSPRFTKWLFSDVLESGNVQLLISLAVFMICFSISRLSFSSFQNLINAKIQTKQSIAVQAAVMNRLMSLPAPFFKQYAAGELMELSSHLQSLCSTLFRSIGLTGLSSLFSLIYIGQIFAFAPSMVLPSFVVTVLTLLLSLITTFRQISISREKMNLSTKTAGLTYATITGIQKIKLAGAEKRMFSRWAKQYAKEAELEYNPPAFLKVSSSVGLAISLFGTLLIYYIAVSNHVPTADYYAFNAAYGMVSAAFTALSSVAVSVAGIRPTLEMARPIMEAEPEIQDGRERINSLRGSITLNHVSFRYDDSMPNVIDDLSLTVRAGEYLAIVGSTGCGKSTLLRLLLGFETPRSGTIFYDRKNMSQIDLASLRSKIGVVLQDGKLFQGDIFSNIIISAPQLTLDDAWRAAEIASMADDIRAMPMGMQTIIGEGQGGISGGQKQRLMIARAIAPRPKILFFDEATSALDNVTQKKISDAIDALKCTRIVIAHRLSTIQHADRIIYLDKGKIAEEGSYQELIQKNGLFAALVERQRLDIKDK